MKTEMDFDRILTLWDRFETSSAASFEMEFQGTRLKWEKPGMQVPGGLAGYAGMQLSAGVSAGANAFGAVSGSADSSSVAGASPAGVGASNKGNANSSGRKADSDARTADSSAEILAPLVGTFYRAASPEGEPFVKEGQKVKKGDVVGIIEAMKLMNEITADRDGTVQDIPAENGALVGFHQVLVRLLPEA